MISVVDLEKGVEVEAQSGQDDLINFFFSRPFQMIWNSSDCDSNSHFDCLTFAGESRNKCFMKIMEIPGTSWYHLFSYH